MGNVSERMTFRSFQKKGSSMKGVTPGTVLKILKRTYPDAGCTLTYESPLHLLIATILSAQCTDERVNQVTPGLFRKYPSAEALHQALLACDDAGTWTREVAADWWINFGCPKKKAFDEQVLAAAGA